MMTNIYDKPISKMIDHRYSEQIEPFFAYSDIVGFFKIPKGFQHDWESTYPISGTSPVSGMIHDYFSRYDSNPIVSKKEAADIYLEFLKFRGQGFIRRYAKYWVVRFAPNYFHKKSVNWKLNN